MFDVAWLVVASMYDAYDIVRLHTIYRRRQSGNATGMSYACVRGLIVVARRATRPACRALAYEALLPSPLRDVMCQQLVRMRTRGGGDAPKAELGCSELR